MWGDYVNQFRLIYIRCHGNQDDNCIRWEKQAFSEQVMVICP